MANLSPNGPDNGFSAEFSAELPMAPPAPRPQSSEKAGTSDSGIGGGQRSLSPESFEMLLAPVEDRVPLEAFREWYKYLRWVSHFDWSEVTFSQSIVPNHISDILRKRPKEGRVDSWTRAVALLTMTIFTSTTGHAWSRDIMDGYMKRDEQNFVDTLAVVMKALYHRRAQQAVAGPSAFYWIALMSLSLPGLVRKCEGPLGDYLRWLGAKVGEGSMPSQARPVNPDRVLAFLLERSGDTPKEQEIQSERARLTRGERTRLFFGENKNRWTSGAILRFLLLLLFFAAFGLGCLLFYQGFEERQVRQDLQAQRLQEIREARAEFRENVLQQP